MARHVLDNPPFVRKGAVRHDAAEMTDIVSMFSDEGIVNIAKVALWCSSNTGTEDEIESTKCQWDFRFCLAGVVVTIMAVNMVDTRNGGPLRYSRIIGWLDIGHFAEDLAETVQLHREHCITYITKAIKREQGK